VTAAAISATATRPAPMRRTAVEPAIGRSYPAR
jgi:hypothetical protein